MGLALVGKGGGGRSTKLQVRADALMAARESRGFDVISCLRCVVAGVRYIGPNDRPRRAAVRDPHTSIRNFLFRFAIPLAPFPSRAEGYAIFHRFSSRAMFDRERLPLASLGNFYREFLFC